MLYCCPHCRLNFNATITHDELGWHTSCPRCEGSFDVTTYSASEIVRAVLIGFLIDNKSNMKAHDTTDLEESTYWKQARDMFVTLAILTEKNPDTRDGDNLLAAIYNEAGLSDTVVITDFDYFMWENLT